MDTLFAMVKPRPSVFESIHQDDVLNLSDLDNIDPEQFFRENFRTEGMKTLFTTGFQRFSGKGTTGLIKLTQAMGGGKTHSMIAMGLLAKFPEYRKGILPNSADYNSVGKVRVVAFTGRESDARFGIWGSIAEQLGKKDVFNDYYSPLQAPGEMAWVNLLQGEPLLILLDELPPYLENAKSRMIGNSDLCKVTSTALSNLFSAVGKRELSNVCVVISDLNATYESGSNVIRSQFKNLSNEINRSSLNLEPVDINQGEIYQILRQRLFEDLPDEVEIRKVASAYQKAVEEARQMGYTDMGIDYIHQGVVSSYPFHPSMRDLYARFKENNGFQQTRGLIRMMRQVVAGLWLNDGEKAKNRYLINIYDFDLNVNEVNTMIINIKPTLSPAIAHDIASRGTSVAEELADKYQSDRVIDAAKLILTASLADVPNALLGLDVKELLGDLCAPGTDITVLRQALEDFQIRAWYLQRDKLGRVFFQNTKNLIADMQDKVASYSDELIKATTLTKFLQKGFIPRVQDCYQNVQIFPAREEIKPVRDKVTLVLVEPNSNGGLNADVMDAYNNTLYKNRIMFLTGSYDTMDKMYASAKELQAIEQIVQEMKDDHVPEDNQQFQLAKDTRNKKIIGVLSAMQQTFVTLYYPNKNGMAEAEFSMKFSGNDYNGEQQIKQLLKEKGKFIEEQPGDSIQRRCESRLFPQQSSSIRWSELKERAGTQINWPWHHPQLLDDLLQYCLEHNEWREDGDYIQKGPFEKEHTEVNVSFLRENDETGEYFLKILPSYGDMVYYDTSANVTEASMRVADLSSFVSSELDLYFLCVDSNGEHPTGDVVHYQRPVRVKHDFSVTKDGTKVELQSLPGVKIRYTIDGSNPIESGGLYREPFLVGANTSHIQYVAEVNGEVRYAGQFQVEHDLKSKQLLIDEHKVLWLNHAIYLNDTQSGYAELTRLRKCHAQIDDIHIEILFGGDSFIELNLQTGDYHKPEEIEETLNNLRHVYADERDITLRMDISRFEFASGRDFYNWSEERHTGLEEYKREEIEQ